MKTFSTWPRGQSFVAAAAFTVLIVSSARADYQATVLSDGPKAYYRLNDDTSRSNINKNSGSLGTAGDLTNTFNVKAFPGARAGSGNRAQFFDTGTSYGMIPFNAALNPDNAKPFTIEVWFYPASDQINGGECPINNRVSAGFPDRTGWVFFQRAPNFDYSGKPGYEGVGWNCRMYRGSGSASGLDVVSQVPFEVGTWTHVVVVYDPVDPVTNATLTIYINGVAANTNVWTGGGSGTDPGYVANPSVTAAALSLGAYNNTSGAGNNPYFGAIDEFAFYSNRLSPAQILAHYQNGTNANRATPYDVLIQSANPVVYLRLDEASPGPDVAINMGDLRTDANGANTPGVNHPATSTIVGRTGSGSFGYHWRNGGGTTTQIPWLAQNNPDASVPFTFEGWFRPTHDRMNPGPSPVNNRYVNPNPSANASGAPQSRTGWVIYQRNPSTEAAAVSSESAVGWAFRVYHGTGTGGNDVITAVPYKVGDWTHYVVTWEPQSDIGPAANGGVAWQGTLTAYVNGTAVASNTAATYCANTNPTDDGTPAADLAIGSYNAASGFGEEFEGNIGEVAFYGGYLLTPNQILAHYQAGTNANFGTNYETLVLTAPYDGAGTQRLGPKTYLRFNDPAHYPVANSGTLGYVVDGNLSLTTNTAAGPQSPTYAGFEASNPALPVDGVKQWASFNNPAGLNITGQISLEAWVKPGASQGATARILSHGPQTATLFPGLNLPGSVTNTTEVFLRIDGSGANYSVGSAEYDDGTATTTTHAATFAVPGGDIGGANWIHLVGTYDGTNWKLYRNGLLVAAQASATGALPVLNGDWAIGSTGNGWTNNYAGAVDEVAIYSSALTPRQIATHYVIGRAGTTAITITGSGNNVTIAWPAGTTLQQASVVTGPYTDVAGPPTSPLTIPASGNKFYRWRL